jgi:hypothetical protein
MHPSVHVSTELRYTRHTPRKDETVRVNNTAPTRTELLAFHGASSPGNVIDVSLSA